MTLPANTKMLQTVEVTALETLSPRFVNDIVSLFNLRTKDTYKTIKWLCIGYMSGITAMGTEQAKEVAMEALWLQDYVTDLWLDMAN